jgi:hypothetical protein
MLELRVQPCVGEELLREAEDGHILGVQRGSLGQVSVLSARWGRSMGRLRDERDDVKRKGRWERLWFVGQRFVRERKRVSGAGFCGRMVREKTGIGGLLDLQ